MSKIEEKQQPKEKQSPAPFQTWTHEELLGVIEFLSNHGNHRLSREERERQRKLLGGAEKY